MEKKIKAALITIGRKENRYAREFVEHYLKIGFSHIYILDNNRDGEEHFEDVLQDYIDKGVVTIEDYRDRVLVILQAYTEAYNRHRDKYDWLAIFDMDEFLDIHSGTLNSWLSKRKSDCVLVNWECYGDNGHARYENKPVVERFPKPLPTDLHVQYETHCENDHVKSIIRGGLSDVAFVSTPHVPAGCRSYELANGSICDGAPLHPFDGSAAVLKHYITKTAEEWVDKFRRGGCDRRFDLWQKQYEDRFFAYNKRTKQKERILDSIHEKVVAIVHYNTPELTEAGILSLRKHGGENYRVVIFDNSNEKPFTKKMKGVEVIDNTKGQIIDFDAELAKFPDRCDKIAVWGKCVHGSTKHMLSVQKLWELIPGGFVLMDPDLLIKQNIDFLWQWDQCCVGHIQTAEKQKVPNGHPRLLPFLCFINVPMCINGGARYFDPTRTWGLLPGGKDNRNNFYDTGAVFLEDIQTKKPQCHGKRIDIRPLMEHLFSGSWLKSSPETHRRWLRQYEKLWK